MSSLRLSTNSTNLLLFFLKTSITVTASTFSESYKQSDCAAKSSDDPKRSELYSQQKMTPSFALTGLISKMRWSLNLHLPINYVYRWYWKLSCDDTLNSSIIQHMISASPAGHICDKLVKQLLGTSTYRSFKSFAFVTWHKNSNKINLFLLSKTC
jgi:hypothetical protein